MTRIRFASSMSGCFKIAALFASTLIVIAYASVDSSHAIKDMTDSTKRFLESLTSSQASKARMAFDDGERSNWAYVPKDRRGVPLKDLNPRQRDLVTDVLESLLSEGGLSKVENIIALEGVLFALEGAAHRDVELYFLSVFGEPSQKGSWGWRFEGHHLSLNVTIVDGEALATAPNFWGANPAEVRERSDSMKGLRTLAREEDAARELLALLSASQRRQAIFKEEAFRDVVTKAKPIVERLEPVGVAYADLNEKQRQGLRGLIEVYLGNMRPDIAAARWQAIESAGLESVRFGWAGGQNRGEGHYYRVQGPSFLIEYDNVQGGSNHIHAVWRDFEGDFGRDVLGEHYRHGHDH